MSSTAILKSLQSLGVAEAIRQSLYLFPTLEAIHVVALGLVFGTIMVVDLRILGLASTERPYSRLSHDMLRWTWIAFAVAALTGSLMFITNASVYWSNTFFRLKMLLILLAGINMAVFQLTVGRAREWHEMRRAPPLGIVCGIASMTIWILVITAGRSIGFTTTGAAAKQAPVAPNIDFDSLVSPAATAPAPASPPPAARQPRSGERAPGSQ